MLYSSEHIAHPQIHLSVVMLIDFGDQISNLLVEKTTTTELIFILYKVEDIPS